MSCTFGFVRHAGESEIRRLFHSFRQQYTSLLLVNFERVLRVSKISDLERLTSAVSKLYVYSFGGTGQ